jgi:hypothetical protein
MGQEPSFPRRWLRGSLFFVSGLALVSPSRVVAAEVPLDASRLEPVHVEVSAVEYRGRAAVRVVEAPGSEDTQTLAIVPGVSFHDGTIEIDVAGSPRQGAIGGARGFVGIAFRVQRNPLRYECFYLRPTNGRAEDQLRRNHSAQYVSEPDWPWHRLRKESPGVYESYVDLMPGEWTKVKVVVAGTDARLYVHGAEQPCLVVRDLKLGDSEGGLALWIGPGTEAHFANLRVAK